MNPSPLSQILKAVAWRNRIQCFFDSSCMGLFCTGGIAVVFSGLRLFGFFASFSIPLLLAISLGLGVAVGFLYAIFLSRDRKIPSRQIDAHYHLKDRILTARDFMEKAPDSPMSRLLIEDVNSRVPHLDAVAVRPYELPRCFFHALSCFALAVFLGGFSSSPGSSGKMEFAEPHAVLQRTVENIEQEILKPLEEQIRENPQEEQLRILQEQLREITLRIQKSTDDPKEMLAALSELEISIQKTIERFDLENTAAALQDIGAALSTTEPTRSIGKSLQSGEHREAARGLEHLDLSTLSIHEKRTLSDQLDNAGEKMRRRNQNDLAEKVEQLAQEIREGKTDSMKESLGEIADISKKQGVRREIAQGMERKISSVKMSKSEHTRMDATGNDQFTPDSLSPSQNWGKSAAGDPRTGPQTALDSQRDLQKLTGVHGQGNSEFETFHSTEFEGTTVNRSYEEIHREYQRQSEAVLQSEPVPLGERQIIRRYFESIRPRE